MKRRTGNEPDEGMIGRYRSGSLECNLVRKSGEVSRLLAQVRHACVPKKRDLSVIVLFPRILGL